MASSKSRRIADKRRKLRGTLFTEVREDGVVKYYPKTGKEVYCEASWQETGVCWSCHQHAITCGRCLQCGALPKTSARDLITGRLLTNPQETP